MTKILLHPTAYGIASDEQLVDLVRAGDDRAFAAIHDRYEARLAAYARQLLGGAHHDAEEVVQDAFVRALGALRANDREMALRAWLYTIVRNPAPAVLPPPAAAGAPPSGAGRSARPTSSRTPPSWPTRAAIRTSASRGPRSSAPSSP